MFKLWARIMLVWGLLFATAGAVASAQVGPMASVVTVTNCTDSGLRSALNSYDTIYFNCAANPATITLTSQITITRNTIIDGGGKVILDGQGTHRIIRVNNYTDLLLKNITLQNGHAVNGDDGARPAQGGAVLLGVWSDATFDNVKFLNNKADAIGTMGTSDACEGGGAVFLSGFNYGEVFNSTFSGNVARNGAAINNLGADLVIDNTTFENNLATLPTSNTQDGCGGGGALYVDGANPTSQGGQEKITINRSVFRGNQTDRKGGAIFLYLYSTNSNLHTIGDQVSISYSTFEGNRAESPSPGGLIAGGGGAIDYQGASIAGTMKLTVRNSTFNNNHADFLGGGIWSEGSPLELYNVTIANNEAKNTKAGSYNAGSGGGLMIGNGDTAVTGAGTRLINVTIAGNTANFKGGGVSHWATSAPSQAKMANTIIASNTSTSGANNCTFTFTTLGGNVQYPTKTGSDADCATGITFGNPALGALANNGGFTKTMSIGSGAAVNHGSATYCTGFTALDQRGYGRSGACDSGAFEYNGIALDKKLYIPIIRK